MKISIGHQIRRFFDLPPQTRRPLIALALFFVSAVILVVYNSSARTTKSLAQESFETWLRSKEVLLSQPSTPPSEFPSIKLTIEAPEGDTKIAWLLDANIEPTSTSKIMRIVSLAREANIYDLPPHGGGKQVSKIEMVIDDHGKTFPIEFYENQIKGNPPAELLLKLFQIYAGVRNSGVSTASTSEDQSSGEGNG